MYAPVVPKQCGRQTIQMNRIEMIIVRLSQSTSGDDRMMSIHTHHFFLSFGWMNESMYRGRLVVIQWEFLIVTYISEIPWEIWFFHGEVRRTTEGGANRFLIFVTIGKMSGRFLSFWRRLTLTLNLSRICLATLSVNSFRLHSPSPFLKQWPPRMLTPIQAQRSDLQTYLENLKEWWHPSLATRRCLSFPLTRPLNHSSIMWLR